MPHDYVAKLLRQINSSLPGDAEKIPDDISGLAFTQIYLLGELFELKRTRREPLSLSTISQETGFSKATICASLKKLRKAGYIQMRMDDVDNRRKEIALTPRAWQVEASVTRYMSASDRALCAGIPPKDLQTMEQALRMILQNAKKSGAKACE